MEPPADAVSIGDGHAITFSEFRGESVGINHWHRGADGAWCKGWVTFKDSAWNRAFGGALDGWDVVQREPLTLTPSILC